MTMWDFILHSLGLCHCRHIHFDATDLILIWGSIGWFFSSQWMKIKSKWKEWHR